MHDQSPHEPGKKNPGPGRSTGPLTPGGKSRSSMNRLDHGCRSEQLILPTEDPAEYEFTYNGWLEAYPCDGDPEAQTLVFETAKAHWFLKRNEKRLHQIESRLPADAWLWTDDNHKLLANATRYKTAAERSFFRWYKALEAHYRREFHRRDLAERARARAAALHLQWLNKSQEALADSLKIEQYAQILGDDDHCITALIPTNDQIQAAVAARPEPPRLIARYLYFVNGVPAAYEWANPTPAQREFKTIGLQTMLYDDWLLAIQREQAAATGHLGPAPSGNFLHLPPGDAPNAPPAAPAPNHAGDAPHPPPTP